MCQNILGDYSTHWGTKVAHTIPCRLCAKQKTALPLPKLRLYVTAIKTTQATQNVGYDKELRTQIKPAREFLEPVAQINGPRTEAMSWIPSARHLIWNPQKKDPSSSSFSTWTFKTSFWGFQSWLRCQLTNSVRKILEISLVGKGCIIWSEI